MSQALPFAAIVAHIRQLCAEKRTGTLFIMHDRRLQGQLIIEDGKIVFLFSHGKRDGNALPLLATIPEGTIQFVEGAVPLKTSPPATADILDYLANAAPAASSAVPSNEELAPVPLSMFAKTVLEETLKEFIGPVAKLVCSDHFRTIATINAAIQALADEIPDSSAAARFRELARQRLD